jgi:amino-acid N-acetyltransferase
MGSFLRRPSLRLLAFSLRSKHQLQPQTLWLRTIGPRREKVQWHMALSLVHEPPAPSFPPELAISLIPTESESTEPFMRTRKAQLEDARSIHQLIHSFTHDGTLLPRRYTEICENIHTFTVVEAGSRFLGCAALHVYGPHLAEIRSIVVRSDIKGHGAGGLLVHALLDQAKASSIKCVCLVTRIPSLFEHFTFRVVQRQALSDKLQKDCIACCRRNACDETAMAIGDLPEPSTVPSGRFFHPPHHMDLVQLQP